MRSNLWVGVGVVLVVALVGAQPMPIAVDANSSLTFTDRDYSKTTRYELRYVSSAPCLPTNPGRGSGRATPKKLAKPAQGTGGVIRIAKAFETMPQDCAFQVAIFAISGTNQHPRISRPTDFIVRRSTPQATVRVPPPIEYRAPTSSNGLSAVTIIP